jgi:ATP-dependent Clp protease ATP-binding subunit ClpC
MALPVSKEQFFDIFGINPSDRTLRLLQASKTEAIDFRHGYIGTEHLLMGGLTVEPAKNILASLGAEPPKVRSAVEYIVGKGWINVNPDDINLSPRSINTLLLSKDEATQLSKVEVDTDHVLLGIMRDGDGIGASVLLSLGITGSILRTAVMANLEETNISQ